MTLQGTNTYLLGRRPPFILLDTGEGKKEYIPILKSALNESTSERNNSQLVSDVVISHDHPDHWGGIGQVLALLRTLWEEKHGTIAYVPPRIHKFPDNLSSGLNSHLQLIGRGDCILTTGGDVLHNLEHDQILKGSDLDLRIVHSPGHTQDSICVILEKENSLFTADTVLGAGTAVFSDLTLYMRSLKQLYEMKSQYMTIHPGHGPVIEDGPAKIQEYIKHRQEREDEILRLLASPSPRPESQYWSVMDLVSKIYAAYPRNLWDWAARGILLHLGKLVHDGKVEKVGEEGWKLRTTDRL